MRGPRLVPRSMLMGTTTKTKGSVQGRAIMVRPATYESTNHAG